MTIGLKVSRSVSRSVLICLKVSRSVDMSEVIKGCLKGKKGKGEKSKVVHLHSAFSI